LAAEKGLLVLEALSDSIEEGEDDDEDDDAIKKFFVSSSSTTHLTLV
jgi:hypothetical protein